MFQSSKAVTRQPNQTTHVARKSRALVRAESYFRASPQGEVDVDGLVDVHRFW
jgi:hypothetical protein